jgi:hypothetical protein
VTPPNVEDLLRELAPQALGAVARRYGEFADAEDAVQEALVTAAAEWPGRMGCDTEDVYLAGGVFEDGEDVEPGQGGGSRWNTSPARIPRAWARRN